MQSGIQIHCAAERHIDDRLNREIIVLQRVAFPQEPHFKNKRWVYTLPLPEDLWFHAREKGDLVGNVWLHHRTVQTSDGPRNIGGVANVCSAPAHRGSGAAKACMRAAADYMIANKAIDAGLLFCGKVVQRFYESLGWHLTNNRYLARQPDGSVQPVHPECRVMYLDASNGLMPWPTGDIDLNGPEW